MHFAVKHLGGAESEHYSAPFASAHLEYHLQQPTAVVHVAVHHSSGTLSSHFSAHYAVEHWRTTESGR